MPAPSILKLLEVKIMKLTLISNPSTNADEIYNTVAQNCNFYIDSNGEAFMVCYDRGTYTLVYLSYADLAKRFINLLVFQHYNCTVRNSDIQTAYDTICALVTACSKKSGRLHTCGSCRQQCLLRFSRPVRRYC